jgi:hypothetical protein
MRQPTSGKTAASINNRRRPNRRGLGDEFTSVVVDAWAEKLLITDHPLAFQCRQGLFAKNMPGFLGLKSGSVVGFGVRFNWICRLPDSNQYA